MSQLRGQATGTLINSTTYDSYGRILNQSNPGAADSLAFAGREYDAETGLYYFRARYFDDLLGHFISEDPSGARAGDFNFRRYCSNNPLANIDRFGLDDLDEYVRVVDESKRMAAAESLVTYAAANVTILTTQEFVNNYSVFLVQFGDDLFGEAGKLKGLAACLGAVYLNYQATTFRINSLFTAEEAIQYQYGYTYTFSIALAIRTEALSSASTNRSIGTQECYNEFQAP